MDNLFDFQKVQKCFTDHMRDPEHCLISSIEDRRVKIYRELIYNNIEGFIASGFPVLRSIVKDDSWHKLIRSFVKLHQSKSPYFSEVSKEFLTFLENNTISLESEFPFIKELAHYEWVELALMIDPIELQNIKVDDSIDLLNGCPIVSPLAWPLIYEYDVCRIGKNYLPTSPPEAPFITIVYRNREDDVEFTEINIITFQLLELLKAEPKLNGQAILELLAKNLPHFPEEIIVSNGLDILRQLMKRDIILGVRH